MDMRLGALPGPWDIIRPLCTVLGQVALTIATTPALTGSGLWLYGDTPVWNEKHKTIRPTLVGHEHLRSLKWACWSEKLSDKKVEDVFWNNAARLFNVH